MYSSSSSSSGGGGGGGGYSRHGSSGGCHSSGSDIGSGSAISTCIVRRCTSSGGHHCFRHSSRICRCCTCRSGGSGIST